MDVKCVLIADFEKVCRICMKFDETFLSISSFKIIDMITACTSVQIWENDDLPNQICNACFLQLENTISFKQLCENSDNTFRQIIEQNKINSWNTESDLDNVKDEELEDYPIHIKEESADQNEVKISKTSNNDEVLENENISELHRIKTRKKSVQYKYEEESEDDEGSVCEGDDESDLQKYKCEKCLLSFKKVNVLGLHMAKKHNAEGVKCKECSLICYHPLHLSSHENFHKKFKYDKNQLAEKALTSCKLCSKKVIKNSIARHMRRVHKVESKRTCVKCETCDETFKSKRILVKHIRKMHPKVKIKRKRNRGQIVNCEICGKSLTRGTIGYHMATHGDREKLSCELCDHKFISKVTLKKHVKVFHTNSAAICLCSVCGLKVQSNFDLERHLLTHTDERPYACDKCNKKYRRISHLNIHVSRAHLNERNFVCTFCSEAFFDKKILLNHVRRHTGEKPYKCPMCEKRFIQKIALTVHMKVHTNTF